jgi:hypothetical protein
MDNNKYNIVNHKNNKSSKNSFTLITNYKIYPHYFNIIIIYEEILSNIANSLFIHQN